MPHLPNTPRADPSSAARRRIIRAWRALTSPRGSRRAGPGERTLVACSGGADSSALLLALAEVGGAKSKLVVGHVVHDLRPREQALADRDAVRTLAARLGLEFVESEISVRGKGNAEAAARRLRYQALAKMAMANQCGFVATAHHAEDQLETMLMAMLRGAGPRGMSGVAVRRLERLENLWCVWIIRPLLGDRLGRVAATTRAEAETICRVAGWVWQHDASNDDLSLLRNALRREVLPVLERLRPGAAIRAARSAGVLKDSAIVIRQRAKVLWKQHGESDVPLMWTRAALRRESPVVVGEMLGWLCGASGQGEAISRRTLAPILGAIADRGTDPRQFPLGVLTIRVTAHAVTIQPA